MLFTTIRVATPSITLTTLVDERAPVVGIAVKHTSEALVRNVESL